MNVFLVYLFKIDIIDNELELNKLNKNDLPG